MATIGSWDRESVISELNQGRDLANELKRQIYPSTTSREACEYLLEKILSSYDNSLALLNCMDILHSNNGQAHKNINKKRKRSATWSEQVQLCCGERDDDDGYNWRKYGQKGILGANHPRSYYRCTHRHTQGCLATKQVQQADQDPSIFQVLYRGKHTCVQETRKHNKERVQVDTKNPFVSKDFIPFVSPSTSESYLSQSPSHVNGLLIDNDLQRFGTEFNEIISNPNSNSSFEDLDLFDCVDFDSFLLDGADYFK